MPGYGTYGGVYGVYSPLPFTSNFILQSFHNSFRTIRYGWVVAGSEGWLNIDRMSHNTPGPQQGGGFFDPDEGFVFSMGQNTTGLMRTAYLVFTVENPIYNGYVSVIQLSYPVYTTDPPSITIDCRAQPFGSPLLIDTSQSGGELPPVFNVSQAAWYYYSPDPWITNLSHPPGFVGFFLDPPYRSPVGIGGQASANTGSTSRIGHVRVYDALYSRDFQNGVSPPTTPPLATLTVIQKACGDDGGEGPPGGGGGPNTDFGPAKSGWNFAEQWGYYMEVRESTGTSPHNILFGRANNNGPFGGWDKISTVAATGLDSEPRGVYDPILRRTLVIFTRNVIGGSSIWLYWSDDEGETWGKYTLPITDLAGSKHPTIGQAIDHTLVFAAFFQGPPPTIGADPPPAQLKAVSWGPGEQAMSSGYTLKNAQGQDLTPQDDTFHLVMPGNGSALWFLTFLAKGDTAPSVWYSADANAETWTRVPMTPPTP